MQTKVAILALTLLALVSLMGCSTTSSSTKTEIDSTYQVIPRRITEDNIPGFGSQMFHRPQGGWSIVPVTRDEPPTPVIVFHKEKAKTAKEITAVYNPSDSTLSVTAQALDTSVTSTHSTDNTVIVKSPFLDFLLRPLGIVFLLLIVLVFAYLVIRGFMAAANPIGSVTGPGSSVINFFAGVFKKKT